MTDRPPDSTSVRAPTTTELPFEAPVGASGSGSSGRVSTGLIAIIALALVAIIGGAAGLIVLRGGDDDAETPQAEVASSGGSGAAGSVDEVPSATVDPTTVPEAAPVETTAADGSASNSAPAITAPSTPPSAPEPTPPPTPPPAPAAPSPAQVGPPVIAASVTRPGGLDSCTPPNTTSYEAALASDSSTSTAWMAPGDGVGQRLVFTFPSPVTISEVGLFPGYGKFDPCTADDRFFQLRRIGSVQWSFDDGSSVDQTFTSEKSVQLVQVAPRTTRSVTITIVTTIAPGVARLDHTPISEVVIS